MHDPRARSVVYLRHAPYISPSLRTGPGQTRDCWYKSMALMLFFVRYTRHRLGWSAAPLASLSECNRDGSTRFFTLNTDPSRIKQELFLFISPLLAPISSASILSHFHQFSEAVFGFWYFPIISKTFKETNTVDQNVAGDILTKKFIHFLTFWNGANLRWISFLKTLVSNSKLTF